MSRRSYTIEPQRLEPRRGYVPCLPHQAARIIVLEVTVVPPKHGRKQYRISKTVAQFSGQGAMQRAQDEVARLTRGTNGRPRGKVIARSLTRAEYDAVVKADPSQEAHRWRTMPKGGWSHGGGDA